MRQALIVIFSLFFIVSGKAAMAYYEPVFAPILPYPAPSVAAPVQPAVVPPPENPPVSQVTPSDIPVLETEEPFVVVPVTPPSLTVRSAVEKAKELLLPVLEDFKKKEPGVKPLTSKTGQTAAALALWNKSENTVTVSGGTRGFKFFTADNGGWQIPIVTQAGAETAFRDNDPNLVVVGTVQAEMIPVTVKKKKMYKPVFSYYVPYNKELYSVETLAAGSEYLSALIKTAFDELDKKNIASRAFPGLPLTAVIDPYLIKSIAVIEHADGQIYEDDASEEALGRFLVKLALNKDAALGDAVSSAGARGMAQFIPSTYALMVSKRPDLSLIADFKKGMADHNNAIKAEAAYLDMILADLPQAVRDVYSKDKGAAAAYIAAGYNGGSVRVKKAIAVWGDEWSVSHAKDYSAVNAKAAALKTRIAQIDKKLKTSGLSATDAKNLKAERVKAVADRAAALNRAAEIKNSWLYAETAGYVVKMRRVYGMLAAGFFATPNESQIAVTHDKQLLALAPTVSSGSR
jgi:hypothetical protein